MLLTFHIRVAHFGLLKKENIYTKFLFLLSQFFHPGSPNLGARIKCAQNRHIAVQNGPKISPGYDIYIDIIVSITPGQKRL